MSAEEASAKEEGSVPVTSTRPSGRVRRPLLESLYDSLQTPEAARSKTIENSLGDRFIWIPAGTFWMGSDESDPLHRLNELPRREVQLTQGLYLGVNVVSQKSYVDVMGKNPARYMAGKKELGNYPVEQVSWDEAVAFCAALTNLPAEKSAKRSYRLPTEAEWEYCCRAGGTASYGFGSTLISDQAVFYTPDRPPNKPEQLGKREANAFGLQDMHGNVWQWCADWYEFSPKVVTPLRDPQGPATGEFRVLRGGSWKMPMEKCRSAYRNALLPYQRDSQTGFRIVLVQG